ncbi:MAG: hypothetical protein U9Q30_07775 [Campylobacterota bacterium]|nr:hypothetical protein [Campylobacterota bacterium]
MKKKCNIKKLEIVDDIKFKNTEVKTLDKIKNFVGEQDIKLNYVVEEKPYLEIKKLNCGKRVNIGDYILKDSNGVFYVSTKEAYLKYKEKHKKNK